MASSSRLRRSRALLTAALFTLAVSAHAADPSAADRESARAAMDEGDRKFDKKDYASALASYQAAHAIMGVPTTGYEVAKTQAALGQLIEARDTALAVGRMPKVAREPAAFATARSSASALADSLSDRIPSIEVRVAGVAEGTARSLRIDDSALPAAAQATPRKVNPGHHVIVVNVAGYAEERREIDVAERAHVVVDVAMRSTAPAPAPTTAPPPTAPAAQPPAPPPSPVDAQSAAPRPASVLAYVSLGVGAVGLGVGAVTGVMSLGRASDAKSQCDGTACKPSAQSDIDASRSLAWVSDVAFGVGIAGAVLGTWLLVTRAPADARAGSVPRTGVTAVTITPARGSGVVGIVGHF